MATSSGIVINIADSIDDNYFNPRIENIRISNALTTKVANDVYIPISYTGSGSGYSDPISIGPTGVSGHSDGALIVSGFGSGGNQIIYENIAYRKDFSIDSNLTSGYVDIQFQWDTYNAYGQPISLNSDVANGYIIKIYNDNNKLLKTINDYSLVTGFEATGISGFAGNDSSTGYFFTGISGFAGATGITGFTYNDDGFASGVTGVFTYKNISGGTGTGLSDIWGLYDSGFNISKNTYIPINDSGASGSYGLLESGYEIIKNGYNDNLFTLSAQDQFLIFDGKDPSFKIEISNKTVDGFNFYNSQYFKIILPDVILNSYALNRNNLGFNISSNSATGFSIAKIDDIVEGRYSELESFESELYNHNINISTDGIEQEYYIIPLDKFGTGHIYTVTGSNAGVASFSNQVLISGLSIKQINIGTDPGVRLSWDIIDDFSKDKINEYYDQYIQVFDPILDGSGIDINNFNNGNSAALTTDPISGILISGGTGYGHGSKIYDFTGISGFAGETGVIGYLTGASGDLLTGLSGEITGYTTGYFTYEEVSEFVYGTGYTGTAFGLVESGFSTFSNVIENPLSKNIFSYEEVSSITPLSGNIADITFKDCNCSTNEAGFFLWVNDPSTNQYITGIIITGSVFQNYFIDESGFGLNNSYPYEVSLTLGSGNQIVSSKQSPGSMRFTSTNPSDESLDILFANTSGFGTSITGDVQLSLGQSNKITSNQSGDITFQSTIGNVTSDLFNLTSDPSQPSIFKSDIEIHMPETGFGVTGYKLYFGTSDQNTDPIYFSRYDNGEDTSELRLYLGDNYTDSNYYDKFIVGSTKSPNNTLNPLLTVSSSGPTGAVGIGTQNPNHPFHVRNYYPYQNISVIENLHHEGGGLRISTNSENGTNPTLQVVTKAGGSSNSSFIIGNSGDIRINYDILPTEDPLIKGQIYRDSNNFLKISAG